MKFLILMLAILPLASICGCQNNTSNSTSKLSCPSLPSFALDGAKVAQINLSSNEINQSGSISGNQSTGYTFAGKKGQKFNYQVKNPSICIYLYGPDSQLINNTLPKDGKYIVQIENIQGAGSFDILMSLVSDSVNKQSQKIPAASENIMLGNWSGRYAINDTISILEITRQIGNSFTGQIKSGGKRGGEFVLNVTGNFDLSQKKISFKETSILENSSGVKWFLGENFGEFSDDLKTISGSGSDTKGNRYSWTLSKK